MRARAASVAAWDGDTALAGLEALDAAAATVAGSVGSTGTAHVDASGRANAITSGAAIGGRRAAPAERCPGSGALSAALPIAVPVLGLAVALGRAFGAIVAAGRCGVGAGDARSVGAGPATTGGSTHTSGAGSTSGATAGVTAANGAAAGAAAATGAGMSTMRRSGTSTRRSRQGRCRPGSPSSSPPKARLNSSAWVSKDSSSASISRLRSGRRMRWLSRKPSPAARAGPAGVGSADGVGASMEAVELKRAAPSLLARGGGCGAGSPAGTQACGPARPTGDGLARAPCKHTRTACEPLSYPRLPAADLGSHAHAARGACASDNAVHAMETTT